MAFHFESGDGRSLIVKCEEIQDCVGHVIGILQN